METMKIRGLFILQLACLYAGAQDVRLIAHRGGVVKEDFIENSIPAIKEAVARGFWMVEVDVRETLDGIPVVHHDRTYGKIYGVDKEVKQISLEEACEIKHPRTGDSLLSLDSYLTEANGELAILLDVKDTHSSDFYRGLVALFKKHKVLDPVYVAWSDEARSYFVHVPEVKIGVDPFELHLLSGGEKPHRYFLIGNAAQLTEKTVSKAKRLKIPVMATINTWHYRSMESPLEAARSDIDLMRSLGITWFQIDAEYETWFK